MRLSSMAIEEHAASEVNLRVPSVLQPTFVPVASCSTGATLASHAAFEAPARNWFVLQVALPVMFWWQGAPANAPARDATCSAHVNLW